MSPDLTNSIAIALNPHFDSLEVNALLQAIGNAHANPPLATTGTVGAVLKMTDPGTVPGGETLAYVISYLNTLRDIMIAAGMIDPGAGGGS